MPIAKPPTLGCDVGAGREEENIETKIILA